MEIEVSLRKLFFGILIPAILLAGSVSVLAEEKEELTLQDLSRTEAARFFIAKQYADALAAFQELEKQHPRNILIKRYIASLYDSLQNRELAIQKLEEVLEIDPEDWIARQFLGDIYVRQGNIKEAEKQYLAIQRGNKKDSANGKFAETKLKEIQKIRSAPKTEAGRQMAAQEFMQSVPAQDFAKGEFKKAVQGFEGLLQVYSQDPLIHRFRGIALLRLNNTPEALAAFDEGLRIASENAALHYYKAQAYAQAKDMSKAREEYQWIVANDKGAYQNRAKQALFETLRGETKPSKKWTLTVNNGYEYDTNATYKSSDPAFSTAGDQNSSRFNSNVFGTYRFYQKKNWFFTTDGVYAQSLYTDFPNLQTYTYGAGISALRLLNFFGKTSYLNIRDGVTHTFLKNKFFVLSNTLSPNLIINTTDRTRVNLGYRFTVSAYENRGQFPDFTNRNGLSNGFSVGGTYYLDQAKKNYVTLGYDFDYDRTKGVNYIRWGNTGRMEFHWGTLPSKMEFNLSFRYKDSLYPKYAFGPPDRWDHVFTLTPSLSRPIYKDYLFLTASYSYEAAPAQNNSFQYSKHVAGLQLSARL
jgi:tetratricopeptide (TPR) repeat protein